MNILKIILTVIYAIDCIALTVVVLMQEGKQQGLGSIAGVADTYWGKNKGRSMEGGLVRGTIIMGVIFFVLSIVLNIIRSVRGGTEVGNTLAALACRRNSDGDFFC